MAAKREENFCYEKRQEERDALHSHPFHLFSPYPFFPFGSLFLHSHSQARHVIDKKFFSLLQSFFKKEARSPPEPSMIASQRSFLFSLRPCRRLRFSQFSISHSSF